MQVYVINLARSPDRRARIVTQLGEARVQYNIVNAVEAIDLDLSDTRVVNPMFASASATRPGVVGCALSHLEAYRRVLDDGLERACILEDDVLVPTDLGVLTDAITQHMSGAELVLLNFHSQEPCRITMKGAAHLPSPRLLVQVVDADQVGSAGGYLITREACARMVKTVLPVRVVADDWSFFYREGAIDRLRCVVPMPVVQSPDFRTTMCNGRPGSLYASVRETIAGSGVPILRQALALRRRRHMQRYAIGRTEFVDELSASAPELQDNR